MKKLYRIILVFMVAVITASASVFSVGCSSDGVKKAVKVKNVVLMIGDGMGVNHLKVTEDYYDEPLFIESLSYASGEVTTFSADNEITDSAAAATAMSCGVKTNNGMIAMNEEGNLTNMTEYMHSIGKRVGIIATETVQGATPAGFCAHGNDRNDSIAIIDSQLQVGADLLIGYEGSLSFHISEITAAGYEFCSVLETLKTTLSGKAFVTLEGFKAYGEENDYPTLGNAAEAAFDYLNKDNTNGFFLMVEASHIDKYSHNKDIFGMMKQLKQFDLAVNLMVNKAVADGDTLVIVTADHETGNLCYTQGDEITNELYKSTSHTGQNVKYFIYGKSGVELKEVVDNTDICKLVRQCAG